MEIKIYSSLPEAAKNIRAAVFLDEQGFSTEFDDLDGLARHLLVFENGEAVATCRFFRDPDFGKYAVGRIAVSKAWRGRGIGTKMLSVVSELLANEGEELLILHAQDRVLPFYEKQGFVPTDRKDDDEGVPHTWLTKKLR